MPYQLKKVIAAATIAATTFAFAGGSYANGFGVSSVPSMPNPNSVPNIQVPQQHSQPGDAWVRPLPDFSGANRPGVAGGYQGQNGSGHIVVRPGSNGVEGQIKVPIPGS